ncbi:hypothetical protein B0H14DRAFT_2575348 [Mycena olivaceomarginata]|nr:hypothetical protein B0H14DRAFT_2575348 [Mycena olivaceomarginata]
MWAVMSTLQDQGNTSIIFPYLSRLWHQRSAAIVPTPATVVPPPPAPVTFHPRGPWVGYKAKALAATAFNEMLGYNMVGAIALQISITYSVFLSRSSYQMRNAFLVWHIMSAPHTAAITRFAEQLPIDVLRPSTSDIVTLRRSSISLTVSTCKTGQPLPRAPGIRRAHHRLVLFFQTIRLPTPFLLFVHEQLIIPPDLANPYIVSTPLAEAGTQQNGMEFPSLRNYNNHCVPRSRRQTLFTLSLRLDGPEWTGWGVFRPWTFKERSEESLTRLARGLP